MNLSTKIYSEKWKSIKKLLLWESHEEHLLNIPSDETISQIGQLYYIFYRRYLERRHLYGKRNILNLNFLICRFLEIIGQEVYCPEFPYPTGKALRHLWFVWNDVCRDLKWKVKYYKKLNQRQFINGCFKRIKS